MATKKQSNFRLSDDARAILAAQAARRGLTETAFLEIALREYRESDRKTNADRRQRAWFRYRDKSDLKPPLDTLDAMRVFNAGYSAGWTDFQLRHFTDSELEFVDFREIPLTKKGRK